MDSQETRKGIEKDRYIDGYSQSQILHTTKYKILLYESYIHDLLLTVDALTQTLLFAKKEQVEKYKTPCCKIYNAWHYTNNKVNIGLTMSYYLLDEEKIQAFVITLILFFEKFFNSFKELVN